MSEPFPGYGAESSQGPPLMRGMYFAVDEEGTLHITAERDGALVEHCTFFGNVVFHPAVTSVPDTFPCAWVDDLDL